jgi:DNA polymerase III subunit beta
MDILIQRDMLLKPLQAISSIAEKKQTNPILANVLLNAQDGKLSLTATDADMELVYFTTPETLTVTGTTTVSARKLFDICRTLPEKTPLRLTLEPPYLMVYAENGYFTLTTLPSHDFPRMEESTYGTSFVLQQAQLKSILAKTHFAMAQQDVRHYLNGTYIDISQQVMKGVAADGHRLAIASIQEPRIGSIEAHFILPRKSVLELIRLFSADQGQEATIDIGEHRFRITSHDFIFTTTLINARYPDYNRLVPQATTIATGDREQIKQALTRTAILSNETFRGVRCQFDQNQLLITANNAEQEQAEETVTLDYAGSKTEIGFNVAYLLDVVSAIAAKTIRCAWADPNGGMLIEAVENDQSLYVIMPLRI